MRPDTINLNIEEHYTPEEKAEIAVKLAQQIADREQVKLDKQASDAAFNERLKKADAEISELAKRYNKGCETAVIGCHIRYNIPEPGKKSYWRMDKEELVETHDMSWGEKQEELQLNLPEKEAEETPEPPTIPEPPKNAEISFRYIQDVAATIAVLPSEAQANAIEEMAGKLAPLILAQGSIADRNGNPEVVSSLEAAGEIAETWLYGCVMLDHADEEEGKADGANA